MAKIFNLGSINADYFYNLPHLPGPGETLAATALKTGLGGKGANQSVAAALAGAEVYHIGAVGEDGQWAIDGLGALGVEIEHIRKIDTPTAHAIVMIDPQGENQIVIYPGANHAQDIQAIKSALSTAKAGDWLMLQNETSHQVEAARLARDNGLNVVYSAAPFRAEAVRDVLPYTSLLIMNDVEARQLCEAFNTEIDKLPVSKILITKGSEGADWIDTETQKTVSIQAFSVSAIDTTGAGDTFAGYTIAGLANDLSPKEALEHASAAAAISVTRSGASEAIPNLAEVQAFLAQLPANGAASPQS